MLNMLFTVTVVKSKPAKRKVAEPEAVASPKKVKTAPQPPPVKAGMYF